jgi:hypothetical protein
MKRIKGHPSVAWIIANKNGRVYRPNPNDRIIKLSYMGNGYTLRYDVPRLFDTEAYTLRFRLSAKTGSFSEPIDEPKYIEHSCVIGGGEPFLFKQDLKKEVAVYINYFGDDRESIEEEIMLLTLQSS